MIRVNIDRLLADTELANRFFAELDNGAVAVLPTDTLYGFAVAAHSTSAVDRVYRIKSRSSQKPLILFVSCIDDLASLGIETPPGVRSQLLQHWPGALTAVLPAAKHQALAAFTFGSIGVRVPAHPSLLQLLGRLPCRILTTSANRSGDPSDNNPDLIAAEFSDEIDWLIDDGILPPGLPSTVVDFSRVPPIILRQGKIKV
ncbi:MAG TPA: L-threonylcarbamoyladenylate synthase [Candidatus Rifleibacterium sp.]|nr:L-threonylcarbamoyladenylate synthase [Candidatus Rifleibacterium sp.]HPT44747.1 L-threonylcarbamoyladenylate synthase [Candidatus Rifleibacterium sp.]